VIVRPAGNGSYELVAGERRWRAAQIAGLLKIPAVVREVADDHLLEVALLENLQREGLNPIETAFAFRTLIDDLGLTQQDVADRVGKDRATVANLLRLLNLPTAVQDLVKSGQISLGHAKALASLGSPPEQVRLAERTVSEALSVRQLEALVRRAAGEPAASERSTPSRDPNVAAAEQRLQQAMGTKVSIVLGKRGGRLELHFYSHDELERLFQLLMKASEQAVDH